MSKHINLIGQKFGLLTVIERAENTHHGRVQWHCVCDCGGKKTAQATYLQTGDTKSCGCLALEQRRQAAKGKGHLESKRLNRREYASWQAMIARCHNISDQSFADYGGRGVTVNPAWRESFAVFLRDMGARPKGCSLDRIDNSGNYTPDNCRWATPKQQANNRRNNRLITLNGTTQTVAQWADTVGIKANVIHNRLRNGMSEHDAVTRQIQR
jgi:hypothetical protein